MKNLMKTLTGAFMVLSLVLVSCSPTDGANGADGVNGVDGAPGPDGQDGQDGQDGNANVISSGWIPIDFGPVPATIATFNIFNSNLTAANLTDAAFLVYGRYNGPELAIPIVFSNRSYFYLLHVSLNLLEMVGSSLDGSSLTFTDFAEVRFVIIPPGPGFSGGSNNSDKIIDDLENQGVDVSNYEEVAAYFNLTK